MKIDLANQARLTFVASIAVCAIVICNPSNTLAATAQVSSISTGDARPVGNHVRNNSVEDRIKHLHDQLKITPDQEAQWSSVAQVMLVNASSVDSAIKDRIEKAKSMNAVEDLVSYQAIAAAHAEGLKKLAAVFAPLYSAMPEAQQRTVDAVFGHRTDPSKLKTHG